MSVGVAQPGDVGNAYRAPVHLDQAVRSEYIASIRLLYFSLTSLRFSSIAAAHRA